MEQRDFPIASPCSLDWQKMTPADGGRFCGDCKKVVRDLSRLSEGEARALLRTPPREGLCVRYLHDRHGKIFFAGDARAPLLPPSFLHRAKRVAVASVALAALEGCSVSPFENPSEPEHLYESMGGVAYDPNSTLVPTPSPIDAGTGTDAAAERDGGESDAARADGAASTVDGGATDAGSDGSPF